MKLTKFTEKLKNPSRVGRATKIFWGVVLFPFVVVAFLFALIGFGAFGALPTFEELENPRSNIATEIISIDGQNLGNFFVENRSFVEYNELSPELVGALVSTEDSRFYSHSGIDFIGLSRVVVKTIALGDRGQGGGSTISQQIAKALYPRDTIQSGAIARTGRLVITKFKEWITAIMLEKNYTKEELIAMYLNSVEFGSNAYGIKSAARTFYNKTPSELTLEEAAMMVGVVNKPTRFSPVKNPANALARRNTVIDRMESAGFITDAAASQAKAIPILLNYRPISHNEGTATYFREMLRLYMTASEPQRKSFSNDWDYEQELTRWKTDPLYGWCNKNVKADGSAYNLYKDGLKIYTTINSKMQLYAEEAVKDQLETVIQPQFDRQRRNTKTIFYGVTPEQAENIMNSAIMQSERGRLMRREGATKTEIDAAFKKPTEMSIFTYRGDRDTVMTPRDSIIHMKSILRTGFMSMDPTTGYVQAYVGGPNFRNFKYDMVRQGRRQVGSTIKPFVYTFAIDHLGLNPCTMVPNVPVTIDAGVDQWSPREAKKDPYDGELKPLKWGLANSRNNYSAWIMKQSSPVAVADFIHRMGVSSYIDPVYALCLGTPEVSVMEMVGAFATFANRGVHTDPFFVTRIEDKQGNILASFSPQSYDAISEQTAFTMLGMLQNNIAAGTGGRLRYQFQMVGDVGGKTGTTNNQADAWFIGVTPQIAAGAWVGGEERSTHLTGSGEGSVAALPIFGKYMQKVYADKSLGIALSDKFMTPVGVIHYDCDQQSPTTQNETQKREDEFFQ